MTIILDSTGDPQDLTTLDAVKRLLQKPDTDTAQDELLQDLITEASVMLQRELGRKFIPEDNATKTFAYQGNGWVSLAPNDLRSLAAVSYDADGSSPVTVTEGNWRLRSPTGDGTYLGVLLTDYLTTRPSSEQQTVALTGDWGFEDVPADVEHGVKMTVLTWLREHAAYGPEGEIVRYERRGKVPADVLDGLSHYRPILVG